MVVLLKAYHLDSIEGLINLEEEKATLKRFDHVLASLQLDCSYLALECRRQRKRKSSLQNISRYKLVRIDAEISGHLYPDHAHHSVMQNYRQS